MKRHSFLIVSGELMPKCKTLGGFHILETFSMLGTFPKRIFSRLHFLRVFWETVFFLAPVSNRIWKTIQQCSACFIQTAYSGKKHQDSRKMTEACFSNVKDFCLVTLLNWDCNIDFFRGSFFYETSLNVVMGFYLLSKSHIYLVRLHRVNC